HRFKGMHPLGCLPLWGRVGVTLMTFSGLQKNGYCEFPKVHSDQFFSRAVAAFRHTGTAAVPADVPHCPECIHKVREVGDLSVPEDAEGGLHAVPADHAAHDHLMGVL